MSNWVIVPTDEDLRHSRTSRLVKKAASDAARKKKQEEEKAKANKAREDFDKKLKNRKNTYTTSFATRTTYDSNGNLMSPTKPSVGSVSSGANLPKSSKNMSKKKYDEMVSGKGLAKKKSTSTQSIVEKAKSKSVIAKKKKESAGKAKKKNPNARTR